MTPKKFETENYKFYTFLQSSFLRKLKTQAKKVKR